MAEILAFARPIMLSSSTSKRVYVVLLLLGIFTILIYVSNVYNVTAVPKQVVLENDIGNVTAVPKQVVLENDIGNVTAVKQVVLKNDIGSKVLKQLNCQTVHVAMVVGSDTLSWQSYLAIKSVLIHRTTKLHFHFITDSMTRTVLNSMMSSWLLPGVLHDYYDLKETWRRIGKSHDYQNHCYGTLILKLNLMQILPDNVQRVIVVNPTSTVKIDLQELWSVAMSCEDHMITFCSERCVLHCHRDTAVSQKNNRDSILLWGVMTLNLCGIRALQKTNVNTWTLVVKQFDKCGPDSIERFREVVQEWSITLDVTNSNRNPYTRTNIVQNAMCRESISDFNSQERNTNHTLNNICKYVREYDGNILRYNQYQVVDNTGNNCAIETQTLVEPAPDAKDICKLFVWEKKTRRRELPFLLQYSYNTTDTHDVTLINHLDCNRLHLMERSIRNWEGPINFGIQVSDSEVQTIIDFISNSTILRERRNISYHLLFRIGPSYPINPLRVLALTHAVTPYVLHDDIDFMPSYGMYTTLKADLRQIGNLNKVAVVVPAFETMDPDLKFPHNRKEMLSLIAKKKVYQFHVKQFAPGHRQTNYPKWVKATEPYTVKWKHSYEPFCVLKKSAVTFDTHFVGRFGDKNSYNTELHMAGFKFIAVHDCFIIHMPHPENVQNKPNLLKCNQNWQKEWVIQKRKQYNYHKIDVPIASDYK